MKPKVSIIVPVYNVGDCLVNTLDCLVSQTLSNIEVVLVDDGSVDNSGQICDEYAKRWPFVTVIHQKNAGVSVARNTGIDRAQGEYLAFIDADDIISYRFCETLYHAAVCSGADIAMCELKEVPEAQVCQEACDVAARQELPLTKMEAVRMVTDLNCKTGMSVCTKLFKRSVIGEHRFTPDVPLGEDIEFVFAFLAECKKAVLCEQVLYLYVMRDDSAMHKPYDARKETVLRDTYDRILANPVWNQEEKLLQRMIAYRACVCELTILNKMIRDGKHDDPMISEIKKYLRRHVVDVQKADFSAQKKLQIGIASVSFSMYRMVMRFLNRY